MSKEICPQCRHEWASHTHLFHGGDFGCNKLVGRADLDHQPEVCHCKNKLPKGAVIDGSDIECEW
jgi:hypothetical protein